MTYRPDIKPLMWGPPDAVAYAVRSNFERMGIDFSRITSFWPFWEGGNLPYGTISQTPSSAFETYPLPEWHGNKLIFNSNGHGTNNDMLRLPTGAKPSTRKDGTMFFRGTIDGSDSYAASNIVLGNSAAPYSSNTGGYVIRHSATLLSFRHFSTTGFGRFVEAPRPDFGAEWSMLTDIHIEGNSLKGWLNGQPMTEGGNGFGSMSDQSFDAVFGLGSFVDYYGYWGHADLLWFHLGRIHNQQQVAEMLHETPYMPLMPVLRPVYFDLGVTGLDAPTLTAPLNNATGVILRPEFSWT